MIITRSPLRSRSADGERISLRATVSMAVSSSRQPSTITFMSTFVAAYCHMFGLVVRVGVSDAMVAILEESYAK